MRFRYIFMLFFILVSDLSYAKGLKKMGSFLTNSDNAMNAKKRSSVVLHGETVHFYFKIGNILFKNATGAPYEIKLEVRRNMKLVIRTGWILKTAAEPDSSYDNKYLKEYANSNTNIHIDDGFRTGNYTAIIFFRDTNTRRETEFSYGFSLTRKDLMRNYLRGDVTGLYDTTWGTLELIQTKHRVRGFFKKNNGRLEGYIKGYKMWGNWVMEPSYRPPLDLGQFVFEFSRDGKKMFGQFRNKKKRVWYNWEGYLID
ncbi:MAG: hypothetical protein GY714_10330 [Desulfobacterales bacterium]|nr:hypothetical protein [Desulfobacterales bacterium]MCP4162619.1 hypothetical protein [Deltaproteobacteria bacterium]